MKKWEYRIEQHHVDSDHTLCSDALVKFQTENSGKDVPDNVEEFVSIKTIGEQGWELVAVVPFHGPDSDELPGYNMLYFKREIA